MTILSKNIFMYFKSYWSNAL